MTAVSVTTRYLHVANGTATTRTIEAAGITGARSIWADPLYEGPVPGGLSDTELTDVRMRHLAGEPSPVEAAEAAADPPLDSGNDLRQWRAALERHESYGELVLWYEHDLFDQLNLIQLLTWTRDHLPPAKPVSLICIGAFPGRPDFKGLGELTPVELKSLFDAKRPVSPAQYALAQRAWAAFREPTPTALDELRLAGTEALPYLGQAVTRLLQEYPWTRDGLSRSERRLLELANGEEIALRKAFPRMHDGERSYYITDESLAALTRCLARSSPPLLRFDSRDTTGHVLDGAVTLTDAGRSVLSGRLDRVAACGIDRWLGGVHLQSGSRAWRWDDERQRITATNSQFE